MKVALGLLLCAVVGASAKIDVSMIDVNMLPTISDSGEIKPPKSIQDIPKNNANKNSNRVGNPISKSLADAILQHADIVTKPAATDEAKQIVYYDGVETAISDEEEVAVGRSFIGKRDNYCYSAVNAGIQSRQQCKAPSLVQPVKGKKCPQRKCAYRPTYAKFKNKYYLKVVQAPWIQQSVGAVICREPGQLCACNKNCHVCQKRMTCQLQFGWRRHRMVVSVPIRNEAPRIVRAWTTVKVPIRCKCTPPKKN